MYILDMQANREMLSRIKAFLSVYYYQLHGDESSYQKIFNPLDAVYIDPEGKIEDKNENASVIRETIETLNKEVLLHHGISLHLNKKGYFELDSTLDNVDLSGLKKILGTVIRQQIDSMMDLDTTNMHKASFFTKPANGYLSPKGMALVLDYHSQKYPTNCNTFIATNEKNIIEIIQLMHQEGKCGDEVGILWCSNGAHWSAIKLEKDKYNRLHIIHMDALMAGGEIKEVIKHLSPEIKRNVVPHEFSERRQGQSSDCSIFALKDMQKMAKTKNFHEELSKTGDRLPARFMNVAQRQEATIQQFEQAQSPTAVEKAYWADKTKGGSLVDYAFVGRDKPEKSRIKTPELVVTGGRRNLTIAYFRDKYVHNVVTPMLAKHDLATLSAIVQKYDARTYLSKKKSSQLAPGALKEPRGGEPLVPVYNTSSSTARLSNVSNISNLPKTPEMNPIVDMEFENLKSGFLQGLIALQKRNFTYMKHCTGYFKPEHEHENLNVDPASLKKGQLSSNKASIYQHARLRHDYLKAIIEEARKLKDIEPLTVLKNEILNDLNKNIEYDKADQGRFGKDKDVRRMLIDAINAFDQLPGPIIKMAPH